MEIRLRARAIAAPAPAETPPAPESPPEPEGGEGSVTGDAPVWPGEADEASFLADSRARGEPLPSLPAMVAAAEEVDAGRELPPLETLVARIPAGVRDALEDLFRAKFTAVKRFAPAAFKAP